MFRGRKAQKELQMIFGLFILLIITLVVLSIFMKATGRLEWLFGKTEEEEKKAAIEAVMSDCKTSCSRVSGLSSALEYCKKTVEVDLDKDDIIENDKADYGLYEVCEKKIPCFVLLEEGDCNYDGARCEITLKQREDYYDDLTADIDGTPGTASDLCIDENGEDLDTALPEDSSPNWKRRFGFCTPVCGP